MKVISFDTEGRNRLQFYNNYYYINNEYWLDIIIDGEITEYKVSNYGRIYSFKSNKILLPSIDKDGYLFLRINLTNQCKNYRVHRLVMLTFCPIEDPENYQVNHKDGNKQNNCLWNLEWVTCIENIHHAINTGLTNNIGENHFRTELTNDTVHFICQCLEDGKSYTNICELLNIPEYDYKRFKSIIYSIGNRDSWVHISKDYNIINKYQHNTVYGEDIAHVVCAYLEQGKNYDEICKLLYIDTSETKRFKKFMYSIVSKIIFVRVSDNYDIIIPKSEKTPIFTEDQIHHICKMIKEQDADSRTILKSLDIDIDLYDERYKHCIINCISNIRRKKSFVYISDLYF